MAELPITIAHLRLTVEYDGSAFYGFQWQPSVRTVAGVLEAALEALLREAVGVTGSGRTDSGVHASGQVVSIATTASFPYDRLLPALNSVLPEDCRVRETGIVDEEFSARFSALERTYVYAVLNRPAPSALSTRFAWHLPLALDLPAMQAAAGHVVGKHDFRSFCSGLPDGPTTRTVYRFTVEPRGELIRFEIAANGFLHRMVRTLVGTLVEIGRGRRDAGDMPRILAALDRAAAGAAAPPHGLYLAGVRYPDGFDSFAEPPIFGPGSRRLD